MTDWKTLVGKRVLIGKYYGKDQTETKVVEVSPSGKRVKLRFLNGHEGWYLADDWVIREVLSQQDAADPLGD